jgi:hypothetical protein
MDNDANGRAEFDEDILTFDVPDDALERVQRQFLTDKLRTRSDIALIGIIATGHCNGHRRGLCSRGGSRPTWQNCRSCCASGLSGSGQPQALLILINARKAAFLFYFPKLPKS